MDYLKEAHNFLIEKGVENHKEMITPFQVERYMIEFAEQITAKDKTKGDRIVHKKYGTEGFFVNKAERYEIKWDDGSTSFEIPSDIKFK